MKRTLALAILVAFAVASQPADAKTALVKDLNPGRADSDPEPAAKLKRELLFWVTSGPGAGLWRTDASFAGTQLVKRIDAGNAELLRFGQHTVRLGRAIYFWLLGQDQELWRSDGTRGGTKRVRADWDTFTSGVIHPQLVKLNGELYFDAADPKHGTELWRSDGTRRGTKLVADIDPGTNSSYPRELTAIGGKLYFVAARGHHDRLFVSDGTRAGTRSLAVVDHRRPSDPSYDLTGSGGRVYFVNADRRHGLELWRTDGTRKGTRIVKDIRRGGNPTLGTESSDITRGASFPTGLTNVNGGLFFYADDGEHGEELWKSDGTRAGTRLVRDIHPGRAGSIDAVGIPSNPYFLSTEFSYRGLFLFSANDGKHGLELWRSDGTRTGTQLVADIDRGRTDSLGEGERTIYSRFLFDARDQSGRFKLWETDGTRVGTTIFLRRAAGLVTPLADKLVFWSSDSKHGEELWATTKRP